MLSVINSLNPTHFSRMPIFLRLRGQNALGKPYGATAPLAKLTIQVATGFVVGDLFTVILTMKDGTFFSVNFTVSDTPTLNSEFLSWFAFGGSTQDYYNLIANTIAAHPLLSSWISTSAEDAAPNFVITLAAKDVDLVNTVALQKTLSATSSIQQIAAIADDTPDNYAVLLDVFLENTYKSGNWNKVVSLAHKSPTENCVFNFNLAEALHSAMSEALSDLPIPPFNDTNTYLTNNQRRFYARFAEQSGTPISVATWENTEVTTIWRGGISMESTIDFFLTLDKNNSILSYWDKRKVSKQMPLWITWCNYIGDDLTVCLLIKTYDSENQLIYEQVYLDQSSTTVLKPFECLTLPCGYSQFSASADTAKFTVEVINRDVYLNTPDNTIEIVSNKKTFYLDNTNYDDARIVQYFNTYGALETMLFRGDFSIDFGVERNVNVSFGRDSYYGLASQTDEIIERIYTYRTGYLNSNEAKLLEELFINGHAWDISERYVFSLILVSNKFSIYSTWRGENAYELQFKLRRTERNFKNDKDILNGIGGWYNPTSGAFWVDKDNSYWSIP